MENRSELLCEKEEASIGGRLPVAQGFKDVGGGGLDGGDTVVCPVRVHFCEELGDLAPACSFAGFAGFPDEDDEEIEGVAGGADQRMRSGAHEVAERGEELQEQGGLSPDDPLK